jgi:hypothetical protein
VKINDKQRVNWIISRGWIACVGFKRKKNGDLRSEFFRCMDSRGDIDAAMDYAAIRSSQSRRGRGSRIDPVARAKARWVKCPTIRRPL